MMDSYRLLVSCVSFDAVGVASFFNLSKEDDVRKYVVRREVKSQKKENAKPYTKAYVHSY